MAQQTQTTPNRTPFIVIGVLVGIVVILLGGMFVIQSQEESALIEAQSAIAAGEWEEALGSLTAVIHTSPAFIAQHTAEATALRGVARYHTDNVAGALEDFDTALSQNDAFIDAFVYRADLYYELGDFENATSNAQAALEHDDVLNETLRARAKAILALTDAEEATAVLNNESAYLPDDIVAELAYKTALESENIETAQLVLSLSDHLSDEQQVEMWEVVTAVLATTPDSNALQNSIAETLAYENILDESQMAELTLAQAQALFNEGQWEEASEAASLALEEDEELALAHVIIAYKYLRLYELEDAFNQAQHALELEEIALAYYIQGTVQAWRGQFAEARTSLDQALDLAPEHVPSLAMRAYLSYETDDLDGLMSDANEAISLAPASPDALWAKGLAQIYIYEDEEAYLLLSQAIELDDTRAEYYLFREDTYLRGDQWLLQKDDVAKAFELAPSLPIVIAEQYNYDLSFHGDFERPIQADELIENFPDHSAGHKMLMTYYWGVVGDLSTAREYADTMIDIHPNASNYNSYGFFIYTQGEFAESKEAFETALALSANNLGARRGLIQYNARIDNQEGIERLIGEIFEIYPNTKSGRLLSINYLYSNDIDEKWRLLEEIFTTDPQNASALVEKASILYDANEKEEAFEIIDWLIETYPYNGRYWFVRSVFNYRNGDYLAGDYVAAIADGEQALSLDPTNERIYRILALSSMEMGDVFDAVDYIDQAVALPLHDSDALFSQANIYLQAGQFEQSLAILDELEARLQEEDKTEQLSDVQYLRALNYLSQENTELAIETYETVLAEQSNVELVSLVENAMSEISISSLVTLDDGRQLYQDSTIGLEIIFPEEWELVETESEAIYLSAVYDAPLLYGGLNLIVNEIPPDTFTASEFIELVDLSELENVELETLTVENGTATRLSFDLEVQSGIVNRIQRYVLVQGELLVVFSFETRAETLDRLEPDFEEIFFSFTRING